MHRRLSSAAGGSPPVPAWRCGPPVQPVRRRRAQLGPAGRAQPRLEARAGAAWPSPPRPARQLRARTRRRRPARPGDLRPAAPARRGRGGVGADRRQVRPAESVRGAGPAARAIDARRQLRREPARGPACRSRPARLVLALHQVPATAIRAGPAFAAPPTICCWADAGERAVNRLRDRRAAWSTSPRPAVLEPS